MKTPLQKLTVVLILALAVGGCRKKKRNFVPAPKADAGEDDDDGDDDESTSDDKDDKPDEVAAAGDGDGGPTAVATEPGDGDSGDGDSDDPSEISRSVANSLVTFLDKELPAKIKSEDLFTKLARRCAEVEACAPKACRTVLAACAGDDIGGCGVQLQTSCPAFEAVAQGASGSKLEEKTNTWLRDLWGDLVVKTRLALPDKKADRVDELAGRHQL